MAAKLSSDHMPYYVGQRILIEMEFRLLGVPTDPQIVQITAKDPAQGSRSTLTYPSENLTRAGVGLYEASINVNSPGQWHFRAEGAGVVDAVTEIHLDVLDTTV